MLARLPFPFQQPTQPTTSSQQVINIVFLPQGMNNQPTYDAPYRIRSRKLDPRLVTLAREPRQVWSATSMALLPPKTCNPPLIIVHRHH